MLALLKQEEYNLDNYKITFAIVTKDKKIIEIPIPKSYSKAIKDLIYKLEQKNAIKEEITSLQANNI